MIPVNESQPCNVCEENHEKLIYVHRYSAAVKVTNQWAMPDVGQGATLNIPALIDIVVGGYLWNPHIGYLKITAFDPGAQNIKVENPGTSGNAVPGSPIGSCTSFILTPKPS